jgi:phosphoglucosamine mutase
LNAFLNGFTGDTTFVGIAPTPATAFNTLEYGISITASHNPPEYNGLKPLTKKRPFYAQEMNDLRIRYAHREALAEKAGKLSGVKFEKKRVKENKALLKAYVESLPEFKPAIYDFGSGTVCTIKDAIARGGGELLFSEPDPFFKQRVSEPTDETLTVLKQKTVSENKLGFGFDGDGDRLALVVNGRVLDGGIVGAFLAVQNLKKGDKLAMTIDVSEEVFDFLTEYGFHAYYSPVGHINVPEKMEEVGGVYAMEYSGHYCFLNRMLQADAPYNAALISQARPSEVLEFANQFKMKRFVAKESVRVNFAAFEKLVREKEPFAMETIDGVKAKFEDYAFLVRQSQTEPKVRVFIESKTQAGIDKGLKLVQDLLHKTVLR